MLEVQAIGTSDTLAVRNNGVASAPKRTSDPAEKPLAAANSHKAAIRQYQGHWMEPVQARFEAFMNKLNRQTGQLRNKGLETLARIVAGAAAVGIHVSTDGQDGVDLTRGWPLAAGREFNIDGPADYNGSGRTVTSTPTRLTVDWSQHIPDDADPGPECPRDGWVNLTLDIEITDPATGRATVRVINRDIVDDPQTEQDERELANETVTVTQDPDTGRTSIAYTDKAGRRHTVEFAPDGDGEIDVDIDGHDHDVEYEPSRD